MDMQKKVICTALDAGADLAGIASMAALRKSASHTAYKKLGDYSGIGTVENDPLPPSGWFNWPDAIKSVLVVGLSHPQDKPELDWWDGKGTPGNRTLLRIIHRSSQQIQTRLKLKTRKHHYYVEKGGIFLKDAAVLAGFGCIGKNNMLVTPAYGPRVRLRALFIEADLPPTGPVAFDPCSGCPFPCRRVCPENAMADKAHKFSANQFSGNLPARDGHYRREQCNLRMEKDIAQSIESPKGSPSLIRFCRQCEFACPAGKQANRSASSQKHSKMLNIRHR